jgi:penicillin-binding protein 1A
LQSEANEALRAGLLTYSHRHGYRGPVAHIQLTHDTGSDQLNGVLDAYRPSRSLRPAVVVAVDDGKRSATVYVRDKGVVEIPWKGLEWARRYESPTAVGAAPHEPSDVVTPGDIVYVTRSDKSGWRLNQLPQVEGGLVSLNPRDGAILALTGGFDFYLGKFNRVTQAKRQPGSNIKPFIFSAAMEHGFTPATRVSGGPIVVENDAQDAVWRPENYSGKFFGPTRLRKALMESLNLVSVRLVRSMGVDVVRNYISRFGFDPKSLPNGLSLALGSATIPPMTVARAYSVLANGGFLIKPYFIKWIEDSDGNIIQQANPERACVYCSAPSFESDPDHPLQATRVIPADNRFLVTSMMRSVIRGGTGRGALKLGRDDLAGKTGTTNDFRDAWFSGFNDNVETTVWVGFDDSSTLGRGETGARAALPIWINYMRTALKGVPESPLPQPDDVVQVRISPETGKTVAEGDPDGMAEYFRVGTVPEAQSPGGAAGSGSGSPGTGSTTEGLF